MLMNVTLIESENGEFLSLQRIRTVLTTRKTTTRQLKYLIACLDSLDNYRDERVSEVISLYQKHLNQRPDKRSFRYCLQTNLKTKFIIIIICLSPGFNITVVCACSCEKGTQVRLQHKGSQEMLVVLAPVLISLLLLYTRK